MKKLIAFLLMLPLCLTACAPDAEVIYFTPTPDPTAAAAAPKTTNPTEQDGIVLRVLAAPMDSQSEELAVFNKLEKYRSNRKMLPVTFDLTELSTAHITEDYENHPRIAKEYYDTIALKLLAGDDDFDMFFISLYSFNPARGQINSMLRKDYLVSMEQLGLAEMFDSMLPGVKELCSAEGELLLAPIGFRLSTRMLPTDALNRLGITEQDIPRTAGAFTDFLLGIQPEMEAEGIALATGFGADYFMSWFEGQYVDEYMTHGDNTQALWDALLDMLDRLFASGLLAMDYGQWAVNGEHIPYGFPAIAYDTVLFGSGLGLDGGGNDSALREWGNKMMPQILLTEDAKEPIDYGTYLAVNPHSKNMDAIKEYLETLLSEDFRRNINPYDETQNHWHIYDVPALQASANFTYYKDELPHSTRGYTNTWQGYGKNDPFLILYADYIEYHNGTLTAAEWKAKVDRALEFLRDE